MVMFGGQDVLAVEARMRSGGGVCCKSHNQKAVDVLKSALLNTIFIQNRQICKLFEPRRFLKSRRDQILGDRSRYFSKSISDLCFAITFDSRDFNSCHNALFNEQFS